MDQQYILMFSDGYSIGYSFYPNQKAAQVAMEADYKEYQPKDWFEDFKELSSINESSAILYYNGDGVYVWQITPIPQKEKEKACCNCQYCLLDKKDGLYWCTRNIEASVEVKAQDCCSCFRPMPF